MVSLSSVVVADEGQASSALGDEAVILSLDRGFYYGLDPVAAFIWERVQQPVRVEEVRDAVLAAYDVETAQAEQDLLAFLSDLAAEGLIEVRDGTP